jgi:tetratricopeptide (TPR) repeat protein
MVTLLILGATLAPQPARSQSAADAYRSSYQLEAQGRYREALETLVAEPATQADPYVYHLRSGWLAYLAGDHQDSITAYHKAVADKPDAVEPRLGLMLPQMAQLAWKDTVATADEVLRRDPGSYLGASRRAWALYNLGRYGEAESAYRAVLVLHPSDTEMHSGLGWTLLKLGNKAEAAEHFGYVLLVAPDDVTALQGMVAAGS